MILLVELRVIDDVLPAGVHLIAHEDGDDLVLPGGVLQCDAHQAAVLRVHGGFPQLLGVHFAQALIALDGVVLFALGQPAQGFVVVGVFLDTAGALDQIQGRHADVHVALGDELAHVAVEEGEQDGADVGAVLVGIAQNNDLVIFEGADVEILVDVGAKGRDQAAEFLVLQHLIQPLFFGVQGLAAQGQYGLEMPVPALLGAAAGAVALHDEQLVFHRLAARAGAQLAHQRRGLQAVALARHVPGLAGGLADFGGLNGFFNDF